MKYKYDCLNLEYLKMESGLVEVPEDSKDSFAVVTPEKGDLGIARTESKIYKFTGRYWKSVRDYVLGEEYDSEV